MRKSFVWSAKLGQNKANTETSSELPAHIPTTVADTMRAKSPISFALSLDSLLESVAVIRYPYSQKQ